MKLRTLFALLASVSVLQLGLLWIQGAQLYRQQETLQGLRLDIQELAEIIDSNNGQGGEGGNWSPSRHQMRRGHFRLVQEEEEGAKLNKQTHDAAQKALKDASEAQHKLSISEAAKRAEEKEKVKAAQMEWTRWIWASLGIVVAALLLRAWLRRR